MCKFAEVEKAKTSTMHKKNNMPNMLNPCGEPNCMPCAMNVMTAYFSIVNANGNCMNTKSSTSSMHIESKTSSPSKARKRTLVFKP